MGKIVFGNCMGLQKKIALDPSKLALKTWYIDKQNKYLDGNKLTAYTRLRIYVRNRNIDK